MSGIITTLRPISVSGENLNLALDWRGVYPSDAEKIQRLVSEIIQGAVRRGTSAAQIACVKKAGIFDCQGNRIGNMPAEDWAKLRFALRDGFVHSIRTVPPEETDKPLPPVQDGPIEAIFGTVQVPHYLDSIQDREHLIEAIPGETRYEHADRIARITLGEKYGPKNQYTRRAVKGNYQSITPRQNLTMVIRPSAYLKRYFPKADALVSIEVLARNGFVRGAIASSYNYYSGRATLLRSCYAGDGTVDWTSGRAADLATAKEIATFAFLSQMALYRDLKTRYLAQGISIDEEGGLVFEFMPQSLLPTLIGSEAKKNRALVNAYKELEEAGIVKIPDPENPQIKYAVRFRPTPVAMTQYNWANNLEKLVPAAVTGEVEAKRASRAADEVLFQKAKMQTLWKMHACAERIGIDLYLYQSYLADTLFFLQNGEGATQTEELMNRAFLCFLLGVPMITNCKSIVDRTNVLNAVITAMKQWIRMGGELPKRGERYAVCDMAKQKYENYYPFKELVAASLQKGLKITQFSRGKIGYKLNGAWKKWYNPIALYTMHPALLEILPERYFVKPVLRFVAAVVMSLFVTALSLIAWPFIILHSLRWIKEQPRLILGALCMPFKTIVNAFPILSRPFFNIQRYPSFVY